MPSTTVRIGTLRIATAREITRYMEVAAWFEKVLVQPGDYEVTANIGSPTGTVGDSVYWVHVRMPGVVTQSHTPSLFGGVRISSDSPHDRLREGQPGDAWISGVYGHSIAAALLKGLPVLGGTLTLDSEWIVQAEPTPNIVRAR